MIQFADTRSREVIGPFARYLDRICPIEDVLVKVYHPKVKFLGEEGVDGRYDPNDGVIELVAPEVIFPKAERLRNPETYIRDEEHLKALNWYQYSRLFMHLFHHHLDEVAPDWEGPKPTAAGYKWSVLLGVMRGRRTPSPVSKARVQELEASFEGGNDDDCVR